MIWVFAGKPKPSVGTRFSPQPRRGSAPAASPGSDFSPFPQTELGFCRRAAGRDGVLQRWGAAAMGCCSDGPSAAQEEGKGDPRLCQLEHGTCRSPFLGHCFTPPNAMKGPTWEPKQRCSLPSPAWFGVSGLQKAMGGAGC